MSYIFSSVYRNIYIYKLACVLLSLELVKPQPISSIGNLLFPLSDSCLFSLRSRSGAFRSVSSLSSAAMFAMGQGQSANGSTATVVSTKERNQAAVFPSLFRRTLIFKPNGLGLTSKSEQNLQADARWLRAHPDTQIIVIGFCDPSGSEECGHELAERRGARVRELLVKDGVRPLQIVKVKGWENTEPACAAATPRCQEMNRRARIFVAGSNYDH